MSLNPREIGWVESSDSEQGEEVEEMRDLENAPNPISPPPTRDARGPILRVQLETIEANRDYWAHCLIGELIDARQFPVRRLQHALNHAWRLQGRVTVMGREDNSYVIHFERMEDLYYIHAEGPWSVHGALFHLINWRPNLAITEVPLWVQLWGLPLEYQIPHVARKLAQIAGDIMEVDWAPVTPRNIRFMRVRVMVPINKPLVMGLLLRLDNEIHIWIRFRYERIFKFCRSCGRIGHTYPRCDWPEDYATTVLTEQMATIRDELGVEMGIQPSRIHFVNEARAFVNRDHRRSTHVVSYQTMIGPEYYPLNAPAVEFDFDQFAVVVTTTVIEEVSTLDDETDEDGDFLLLPFHIQVPEFGPEDMEVVWDEELVIQEPITDLPELNDADPEIRDMAERFSLNKPQQCMYPLPGVRLSDQGLLENTNEFMLRWVELEPREYGITNAKFDWELPPSENRALSQTWWDLQSYDASNNAPKDIFMIGETNYQWTTPMHRPWRNSTFERGESSSTNANANVTDPLNSHDNSPTVNDLELIVQPFLYPPSEQGITNNVNSESSHMADHLTQEAMNEINDFTNANMTVMGAEMGFWVVDNAPEEAAAENEQNSYWLAPIKQLPDLSQTEEFPILVQARDHLRGIEASRKRRFDSIEELRAEMLKKGHSEPIVISMMGHLKRKRNRTLQHYLPLSDEPGGLACTSTVSRLKQLIVNHSPDILFLQETICNEAKVMQKIKWSDFEYVECVDPKGKSGGLALCWKKTVKLTIVDKTPNWIHGTRQLPWIIFGDFNQIRKASEKLSRCSTSRGSEDFDNFINQSTLIDIPSKGPLFTWSNNRHSEDLVWEKLDRFLSNIKWADIYLNSLVDVMPIAASDHAPILLTTHPNITNGRKPFYFELMWLDFKDGKATIENAWKMQCAGSQAYRVIQKLKNTEKELRQWNRTRVGNIQQQIKDTEANLLHIQETIHHTRDFQREHAERKQLQFYLKCEHTMWAQRAKQLWLKHRDNNTRYFHAIVNMRRKKNRMSGIMDPMGNWITNQEDLKSMSMQYFQNLFQNSAMTDRATLKQYVTNANLTKLTSEQVHILNKPFTKIEIETVVFQMEGSKSPGPDGFATKFYQELWPTVEDDVTNMVASFLQRGFMLQISDSIIMASEILHYHRKIKKAKSFWGVMKVDIFKAYDKLSWHFLEEVLLAHGFPQHWIQLIMQCVTTTTCNVLINGRLTQVFKPHAGLRQGDPISPYLFIMCMNVLSNLFTQAHQQGTIKGIKIGRNAPPINHLFFADDRFSRRILTVASMLRTFG
ncbi:reverse transcriptase [Senna tora]|uniref:Reverse transcriptase n=1 Tax=Senna tora TaxID=362788 RepID=A0A834SV92_9FABA|nr:reverse transcriptase [Senna tora]